ncbi:MAG: nuclear transport factor 2 family protein [Bryobacterales bacterium]|nr:nuclear transport factor 2 family protein [Bryobacterales bacterium]
MRTIFLLLTASVWCAAADPDPVYQAAVNWTNAAVKQDKAALSRLLADDLQYIHAGGQLQDKAGYISTVTTGPARYESFTFSQIKTVRYGPAAAVLTAYVDVKLRTGQTLRVHTLQVYVSNKGNWQMAAHQATLIGR